MKNLLLEEDNLITSFLRDFSIQNRFDKNRIRKDNYLGGSISNYAKNLVMTFPTLCDDSLSPTTASMISRAHERNIVTMLELLFSSAQLRGTDGVDVLKKIHNNIDMDMSVDDYIDTIGQIATAANESSDFKINEGQIRRVVSEMVRELKEPKRSFPVNSFSENSLNDYTVYNHNNGVLIRETKVLNEDKYDPYNDPKFIANRVDAEKLNRFNNKSLDLKQKNLDLLHKKFKHQKTQDQISNGRDKARLGFEKERLKLNRQEFDHQKNRAKAQDKKDQLMANQMMADNISKQLLDQDVKKANEMQPALMIVRYSELDGDGNIYDQRPFVAGVKSRLIPVDSVDIVERLIVKNKTKINFLNFIRATTGEIHLVKDFLLSIKQAKIDAKNAVKKGPAAKMWNVLANRSTKNNLNKLRKKGNDASCITTLVVNQETVNIMKKEYDFDLEKYKNAKMIMDSYNLLGLIIADESIEVVKFLYAGNTMWEQQAYSYLERESNDNSYRKVINLIGKMNGR